MSLIFNALAITFIIVTSIVMIYIFCYIHIVIINKIHNIVTKHVNKNKGELISIIYHLIVILFSFVLWILLIISTIEEINIYSFIILLGGIVWLTSLCVSSTDVACWK